MTHHGSGRQEQKTVRVWRQQAVNIYTGEIVELGEDHAEDRGRQDHVRVFQQAMEALACRRTLGEEAWAVLGVLFGMLDWDNWLVVSQRHVAQKLKMTPQQVSRAVASLKAHGILKQADAPAPRTAYRLCAELAYRGSKNGWYKRRREEQEEQQRSEHKA